MRLVLPLPDGWKPLASIGAEELITPMVEPRLTVRYGAMVPSPLDGESWMKDVLSHELPAGGKLIEKLRAPNQTVTGYPMQLVYTHVVDAADKLIETRLTAFYAMLSHNAAAILRVQAGSGSSDDISDLFARYEEPAKTLFRAASPDFQTGLCTIAALYDGLPGLWERK